VWAWSACLDTVRAIRDEVDERVQRLIAELIDG
jgi:hypothetical protein